MNESQFHRSPLAFTQRDPRAAFTHPFQKLRIGLLALLEIVDGDHAVILVRRQRSYPKRSLAVRPCRADEARWIRPLRLVLGKDHDRRRAGGAIRERR